MKFVLLLLSACFLCSPVILFAQFQNPSGLGLSTLSSLKMQKGSLADIEKAEQEGIPAPIVDSFYRVGPGDEIKISYVGSIADEELHLTVDPEGILFIPKMGAVATAKSFLELKKEIVALIRTKAKNVEIFVQLQKLKTLNNDISGVVTFPGNYNLPGASRLSDLFRKSCTDELGAYKMPGNADLRNVRIQRADGTEEKVDLRSYLQNGKIAGNPNLYCGDRVHVPFWGLTVKVSGAILKNQTCEWRDETLIDLVEYSGGLSPHADSSIRVTRFKSDRQGVETFLLRFPDQCRDFRMMPEDNVVAGSNPLWRNGISVAINGRVKNPGVYTLAKSAKVADLVEVAGGLLADADSLTVCLQRPQLLNNQTNHTTQEYLNSFNTQVAITISEENALLSLANQIQLQEGDVVAVPLQTRSVSVVGKVCRPGVIDYAPDKSWKYYAKKAGGLDDNAYDKYAKVYKKRFNSWVFADNVENMEPGDILMVPETPQEHSWNKFKDLIAVTSGVVSIAATIIVLTAR